MYKHIRISSLKDLIDFKIQALETTYFTLKLTAHYDSLTFSQPVFLLPAEVLLSLPDFKICQELEWPFWKSCLGRTALTTHRCFFALFYFSFGEREGVFTTFQPRWVHGCREHGQLFSQCRSTRGLAASSVPRTKPPVLFTARQRGLCGAGGLRRPPRWRPQPFIPTLPPRAPPPLRTRTRYQPPAAVRGPSLPARPRTGAGRRRASGGRTAPSRGSQ